MTQTITVDPVTRIEGHAKVTIDLDDEGKVSSAGLVINELRGFERILVGMTADKLPTVTARICGICPSAHHLAAVKALENAIGIEPPPAAKLQRELLYMGHFIHSHAVHLFALVGPDLLFGIGGAPEKRNIVKMVDQEPEIAKKALRLRSLGQRINEIIGGRGVHPVTAVMGGMAMPFTLEKQKQIQEMAAESLKLTLELAKTAQDLLNKQLDKNPSLLDTITQPTAYMGTVKDDKVNFIDGFLRTLDADGKVIAEFEAPDYYKYLVERTEDWSYMKPVFFKNGDEETMFRVNTLARLNVAGGMETELAQKALELYRRNYGTPCHTTVMHLEARLIELIYACEKAIELAADSAILGEARTEIKIKAGRGVGHVEAPRGSLFHDYEIDDDGIVRSANLLVATQQNYAAINESIKQAASSFVENKGEDALFNGVEFAIRCYDPCLSCATHALGRMPLEVRVRQRDKSEQIMRREG